MKKGLVNFIMCTTLLTSCSSIAGDDSSDFSSSNQTSVSNTISNIEEVSNTEKDEAVSCIKTLENGKTYIQVDGLPYNLIGAQIRVDGFVNRDFLRYPNAPDYETDQQIEAYFKLAKESNINTLELALQWKDIEKEFDKYNFELVDKLLYLTNKYDLKCEFLWFSSNMCGDGHSYSLPDYIMNDASTYPRYSYNADINSGMYGKYVYLHLDNENLLKREYKAISSLMAHVQSYNEKNEKKNPLIGMQIHNEADGLLRWRLQQRQLKDNGVDVTPERLWNQTLIALNNAGKAVKDSTYKIYTRCNMSPSYGVGEYPQWGGYGFSPLDVLALDYIDIIGDDPYVENPHTINTTIKSYAVNGNYPHIAENMGNYANTPSLFLNAYQAGGSYMFYDFATPNYFIHLNGGGSYQMDQGLFKPDLTYKSHTQETLNIIKGISSMGSLLPTISSEDFAIFNATTTDPATSLTKTISTSDISFTYSTNNGGIAFAIQHEEYVYLYSTKQCEMTINNATFIYKAEIGKYEKNEFIVEEDEIINPTITVNENKLYKIKIREITSATSSTTNDNV